MKKIDLNKSDDLTRLKESLNAVIDKKLAKQRLSEKIASLKGLSFGECKSLFEDTISTLSESTEGKKCIASYVKLLKENNAVKCVYRIIDRVGLDNNADANITAYAWATILEGVDKKQLKEGEQKMYGIYKNACKIAGNVTPEQIDSTLLENKELNDAVKYLTHKSNSSNINMLNERVNSINVLSKTLQEGVVNEKAQVETTKANGEIISELNSIFVNEYADWQNKVLKDLSLCYVSGSDMKELFESYKASCIEAIDAVDDDDVTTKSRLHTMKQQLMEKEYNEATLQDDLFKLAELKETIND